MHLSNSVRGPDFDSEVVLILSFPKDERLGVQLLSGGCPMDCSLPGFSVLHDLPEFAQVHAH